MKKTTFTCDYCHQEIAPSDSTDVEQGPTLYVVTLSPGFVVKTSRSCDEADHQICGLPGHSERHLCAGCSHRLGPLVEVKS